MKQLSKSGRMNFELGIAIALLATFAVVTRVVIRFHLKQTLSLSDYLCILALGLFYAHDAVMLHYILNGPGAGSFELWNLSDVNATALLKSIFAFELLFPVVITSVKLSILCFYRTIFGISKPFRRAAQALAVICLLWLITVTFLTVFQCRPINALWDKQFSEEYCMPFAQVLFGQEITNLLIDLALLYLPISMLRGLSLPKSEKIAVGSIVLLSGMVCITSVLRLSYIGEVLGDQTCDNSMVMATSNAELGVAVACCCLPSYGPILSKAKGFAQSFKSFYSSVRTSSTSQGSGSQDWDRKDLHGSPQVVVNSRGSRGFRGHSWDALSDRDGSSVIKVPSKSIVVETTWNVSDHV